MPPPNASQQAASLLSLQTTKVLRASWAKIFPFAGKLPTMTRPQVLPSLDLDHGFLTPDQIGVKLQTPPDRRSACS